MASFPRYHEQNFFHENRKYPLDVLNRNCYTHLKFRRSSAVEQLTVNQLVVGSIPTAGAKNNTLAVNARCFFMSGRTINISATVQQMIGCAIKFFFGGQRYPQHRVCSPAEVQTPVVINLESTKLACK